jgi:beta-1,4-mannosyltransferase
MEEKNETNIISENEILFPKKQVFFRNIFYNFLNYFFFSLTLIGGLTFSVFISNDEEDYRYGISSENEYYTLFVFLRCLFFPSIVHLFFICFVLLPISFYTAPCKIIPKNNLKIIFRYVSRGTNQESIKESINKTYFLLKRYVPEQYWELDVALDNHVPFEVPVNQHLVPKDYKIFYEETETLYKARALQYALEFTNIEENTWIFHMDEESTFSVETLNELYYFANEQEKKVVGQGAVFYDNNKYVGLQHLLTTLADSMRTTVDFSIFRFQYLLGYPIFGMKGSFILVHSEIEKEIGFNWGADGNITEDAFFSMKLWEKGNKIKFIGAFLKEQSPFTFIDFIKQRKRWYSGLWKVIKSKYIPKKYVSVLAIMLVLWGFSFLSWIPLLLSFIFRYETDNWLNVLLGLLFSIYIYEYVFGLIIKNKDFPLLKGFLQIFLLFPIPLYPFLEGISVLWSLCKKNEGFHIVQKD